mgnify:CR=1 FL=1
MSQGTIRIRGARQHNLKNIDLDIRTNEMTVVTGPSGSGKSSLVFDTLFAEGQRRYVETFSAYARQFLDRMDKPAVDKVEGVPPAIAIDQTNPVRNSRSTVGTMTELNDHLKLLYARSAQLFDKQTAQAVRHDTSESIYAELMMRTADSDARVVMTFPVELPGNTSAEQLEQWLSASGFTRVHAEREIATRAGPHKLLDVVADRFRIQTIEKARAVEAIEVAIKRGGGRLNVYVQSEGQTEQMWRFSTGLHCPDSDTRYTDPTPSLFSFNSAMGACDKCKGFGRVIGVDYGLVLPNDKLTLRAGVIKVMQTPAWKEAQDDLMRHAEAAGVPRDTPWYKLTPEHQAWVINGSPNWNGKWSQHWFGIKRFFEYLESKSYKMHIRVLLSKYRSYTPCGTCGSARLKLEPLLWRLGAKDAADAVLAPALRFMPVGVTWTRAQLEAMPGLCLHDLMRLPIDKLQKFSASLSFAAAGDDAEQKALKSLFEEIQTRLQRQFQRPARASGQARAYGERSPGRNSGRYGDKKNLSPEPMVASPGLARSRLYLDAKGENAREAFILVGLASSAGILTRFADEIADIELTGPAALRVGQMLVDVVASHEMGDSVLITRLAQPHIALAFERLVAAVGAGDGRGLAKNADVLALGDAIRQAITLHHRARTLHSELRSAEMALAEEMTEANFSWVKDIKARLESLEGTEADPDDPMTGSGS